MRKRKTHGHISGDPWTICGMLRRGKTVSIERPTQIGSKGQIGEWESAVTCENCWKAFP